MRKASSCILSIIFFFCCTVASAQQIYKWKDENGQWHFSQTPTRGRTDRSSASTNHSKRNHGQSKIGDLSRQMKNLITQNGYLLKTTSVDTTQELKENVRKLRLMLKEYENTSTVFLVGLSDVVARTDLDIKNQEYISSINKHIILMESYIRLVETTQAAISCREKFGDEACS